MGTWPTFRTVFLDRFLWCVLGGYVCVLGFVLTSCSLLVNMFVYCCGGTNPPTVLQGFSLTCR
jgi:hypothetical protein